MKIGAQLYTVREHAQTEADFAKTIKRIAAIGYTCVQVSGIGPVPAQKVADICTESGIDVVITHTNPERIKNDTSNVIAEHKLMGAKYVGIGSMPGYYSDGFADVKRFVADYTPAAEKIHAAGLTFMYHNHDFEFEKYSDKLIFNYLLEAFPPEKMGVILDLFWVQAAGADPVYWLNKLKGRVEVVHFKDYAIIGGQRKPREVMEGNMNWGTHVAACREAGVEWAFVEQEEFNGKDPFDCLKTSFENLRKAGLC
jgi:sugar phosphate isomerase/epimerase